MEFLLYTFCTKYGHDAAWMAKEAGHTKIVEYLKAKREEKEKVKQKKDSTSVMLYNCNLTMFFNCSY
jgi:hypothetical protein